MNDCSWAEWISLPEWEMQLYITSRRRGMKDYLIFNQVTKFVQRNPDAKIAVLVPKKRKEEEKI